MKLVVGLGNPGKKYDSTLGITSDSKSSEAWPSVIKRGLEEVNLMDCCKNAQSKESERCS